MLEGEIKVGDRLLWGAETPGGAILVVVSMIIRNAERSSVLLTSEGRDFWATESRVREVCVRDE